MKQGDWYLDVHMATGTSSSLLTLPTRTVLITEGVFALWWPGSVAGSGVDSLQAFFPGVQVRFDSQRRANTTAVVVMK
jgi:hypothetical protein